MIKITSVFLIDISSYQSPKGKQEDLSFYEGWIIKILSTDRWDRGKKRYLIKSSKQILNIHQSSPSKILIIIGRTSYPKLNLNVRLE